MDELVPTLDEMLTAARSPQEFASIYLRYVAVLLGQLDPSEIAAFVDRLERARREGRTVFLAGNGGSAATASHMAIDLGVADRFGTPGPLRALAVTDSTPMLTAIANDFSYADVFVRQIEVHYRPGDVLVAISASGNSPNVVAAAEWVKTRGGVVLGLTGFDGGRLKVLCDVAVHVRTPGGEYGPVEDAHLILDHLVTLWLRRNAGNGA